MASRDVKLRAKYGPAHATHVGDGAIIVMYFIDSFVNCILCGWHSCSTNRTLLTVVTMEELFLAQAATPSVLLTKYRG